MTRKPPKKYKICRMCPELTEPTLLVLSHSTCDAWPKARNLASRESLLGRNCWLGLQGSSRMQSRWHTWKLERVACFL